MVITLLATLVILCTTGIMMTIDHSGALNGSMISMGPRATSR